MSTWERESEREREEREPNLVGKRSRCKFWPTKVNSEAATTHHTRWMICEQDTIFHLFSFPQRANQGGWFSYLLTIHMGLTIY